MRPIDKWKQTRGKTPCSGKHHLFFPWDGEVGHSWARLQAEHEAKEICSDCPAKIPCAISSIITIDGVRYAEPGIWAGRDQVERCRSHAIGPVPGTGTKHAQAVGQRARRERNARR